MPPSSTGWGKWWLALQSKAWWSKRAESILLITVCLKS
jgi:hypothetical protein